MVVLFIMLLVMLPIVYIVPLSQLTSNKAELPLLEKFRFQFGQDSIFQFINIY